MRRKTRKALVHFSLFFGVLCLIIYINRPPSSNVTYPWTRIRYQYKSSVPPAHGICPGLKDTEKPALVVSRVQADGDITWFESLREKYHICIYNVDSSSSSNTLQVPANRANEAMPYLTFLIDNYANIPSSGVVFVHGNRYQWHNDHPLYDNLQLLTSLNISRALHPYNYHNLKCDWSLSTCRASAKPQGSMENSMQARLQPWDRRAKSDALMGNAFGVLFGKEGKLGGREILKAQCCAQFVVGREAVWKHSKEEYVALRQWLLDTRTSSTAGLKDDKVIGRIMSYLWHILFIDATVSGGEDRGNGNVDLERLNGYACPTAGDCYCKLYGVCGEELQCSKQGGSCRGRYVLPKNLKLPDDWGVKHMDGGL